MPVKYKIDVLAELKKAGYNTTKLRKDKLLAEGVIQSLRSGKPISFQNLSRICEMLNCQPGDILEYDADGTAPFDDGFRRDEEGFIRLTKKEKHN